MKIGTYYYPEQWPRDQWERDFDNIAEMGMQIVHMGEFAWFDLEPSPGDFRLDWLSQCVEMATARKLAVILCTPTAAPPIWLVRDHPEILPIDDAGRVHRFGGRRHYSPTAPAMVDASRRIVTALAERFGKHPSVIGWQIDNEYCSNFFDQRPHAHEAFRRWLQTRYGDITHLNHAWGNQFWNTYYTDFDQIELPAGRDPKYGNPHQSLDACRFWSWAFAQFNKVQADILKAHFAPPPPGQRQPFITHNFMPFHPDANPADFASDLTLMSWDSYPVSGHSREPDDDTYRLADPDHIGFNHDAMASHLDRWALMELQPGQINWSGVPVLPYPNAIRLWVWTAFAHGAEFVTTYRYRQPRFGIEMFHAGLTTTDGVTLSPGGRQFEQVADEIALLDHSRLPSPGIDCTADCTVGIVFDFDQLWWFKVLPQARRWKAEGWLVSWYAALSKIGLRVRILQPHKPWPTDLRMVIAPGLQMVDDALLVRLGEYASAGGNLVLTCRSGLMDRTGQFVEGPWGKAILPLIGGTIEAYDVMPDGSFGQVEMDSKRYIWGMWGDLLYPDEAAGTRVLATYADQFYAEAAAVIYRRHGVGSVTYCGVAGEQPLIDALVEKLAAKAGLPVRPMPKRVRILKRGPYQIALNYDDKPHEIRPPEGARFLIGTPVLEPAGVAVYEAAESLAPPDPTPAVQATSRKRRARDSAAG